MNLISVDEDKCTQCHLCLKVCLRGCLAEDRGAVFFQGDDKCCNVCGHCVAICPTKAIVHQHMNAREIIELSDTSEVSTDSFLRLVRRRRSHRYFKDREIPFEVLEMLVDSCRWAPTGSNVQSVELMVVQNKDLIKQMSDLGVEYFRQMLRELDEKASPYPDEQEDPMDELVAAPQKRIMIERLIQRCDNEGDPLLWGAPVVAIFHSTPYTSTPKDNCVIAAHTLVLTAETLGIGTCYLGLLQAAINGYEPLRRVINFPSGNKVYSVVVMGYPQLTFQRTVDRKPLELQWR